LAVGARGAILLSDDGEHWNLRRSGTKLGLSSVLGTDDSTRVWAVGGFGTILEGPVQ
jgi:hypothetical protein